jgi:hypothetical protein
MSEFNKKYSGQDNSAQDPSEEIPLRPENRPDIESKLNSLENDIDRRPPLIYRKGTLVALGMSCSLILGIVIGYFLGQQNEQTLNTVKTSQQIQPQLAAMNDLRDQQKKIDLIKTELHLAWQATQKETQELEKTLQTLEKIPDETVLWSSRKFYAKGAVKRHVNVQYTDYSDPKSPQQKEERISFTVNHGKMFSSPEKVLIDQELSNNLKIQAVAGVRKERMNVEGYLVKVTLKNVSAMNAKAALRKKQAELESLLPEKERLYQQAVEEADKEIANIRAGIQD